MRKIVTEVLIRGRVRHGKYGSDDSYGLNGAFLINGPNKTRLRIIASDGTDPDAQNWEHVSVSTADRAPTWDEMCFVKDLFWTDDEAVLQFHPPKQSYVNYHPHCLHMWRHRQKQIELPPTILVGPMTKVSTG